MKKLRKILFLLLLIGLVCSGLIMPQKASAKTSSTTVKKAYYQYVMQNEASLKKKYGYYSKYGLVDVDQNGVKEFVLVQEKAVSVLTYTKGKVKVLKVMKGVEQVTYNKKNKCIIFITSGYSNYCQHVYKVSKSKMTKLFTYEERYGWIDSEVVYFYYKNGKRISYSSYAAFQKKYKRTVLSLKDAYFENYESELRPGFSMTSIVVEAGNTEQLYYRTTSKKVSYKSSNKAVATVSSFGTVTGKKPGKAKITIKDGSKKYTCKVTIIKPSKNTKKDLTKNKVYKYDLTGDGRSDTFRWYLQDYSGRVMFVLNNRIYDMGIYQDEGQEQWLGGVSICDFSTKDNRKELIINFWKPDSNDIDVYYAFKENVGFKRLFVDGSIGRGESVRIPGNNTLVKNVDTPIFDYTLGNYIAQEIDSVANDKRVELTSKEYAVLPSWKNYTYTTYRKLTAYTTPGGKKKAVTIKNDEIFFLQKVKRIGSKVYIKVKTKKGKVGWIKLGKQNFFYEWERYQWG